MSGIKTSLTNLGQSFEKLKAMQNKPPLTRPSILQTIESIYKDCESLMGKADYFAASNGPKLRALAYEIAIAVSKITAEQQVILKTLNELEIVTEQNGYGALVD